MWEELTAGTFKRAPVGALLGPSGQTEHVGAAQGSPRRSSAKTATGGNHDNRLLTNAMTFLLFLKRDIFVFFSRLFKSSRGNGGRRKQ